MSKITVLTPTYNRAYIIHELYQTLLAQTNKNFEWLVIDDGSSDNTELLIKKLINENKIAIRYYYKKNGGKHTAVNLGAKLAEGELLFIVDSDDKLPISSLEKIEYYFNTIKNDSSFAGVCGIRSYFSGKKVGGEVDFSILDCSSLDFRYKHKIKGDMAEVIRTEILREYPFPEQNIGERFIAESVVWNKIACKYKLRYFNETTYLCEYLEDGLSKASIKNRIKSPNNAMLLYSDLYKMSVPLIVKGTSAINYWRFSNYSSLPFNSKLKQIGIFSLLLYPIAIYFRHTDKNK